MTGDFRFNAVHVPAGSSTGGQFGSTSGQTAQQKLSQMHEPSGKGGAGKPSSPWHNGVMAYDPKTKQGPGYDSPKGDATVHQLQQALIRLGITDASGKKLADDGKLGPLTTQAIKEAQKRLGLPQDGKVTPELLKRLTGAGELPAKPAKAAAKPKAPTKPAAPQPAPSHTPTGLNKPRSYNFDDEYAWGGGPMDYYEVSDRAQLSSAAMNDLPDSAFAYVEPGGTKDSEGKTVPRSKRHFVIVDANHVRDALARIGQGAEFGQQALPAVKAAAKKFGITVGDQPARSYEEFGMSAVERRFTLMTVELRAAAGESPRIGGYAAMFSRVSQNLGGFVEVVERSFFNKSRGDGWPDVMARYNHDDNMLLGTTGAGTLRLSIDDTGLDYNVTPPQSRADVLELVQRGDVRKSSFAFRTPTGGDEWGLSEQGYPMRHLVTGQLVDVAPVNAPAYLDTTAGLRSLDPSEVRRLGIGPEAAYRSLALRMEADVDEVRDAAFENDLRRFFARSDNRGPVAKPKPRAFGPAAAAALLARRSDPWAE